MNAPSDPLPDVFWCTRDMLGGVLSSKVEVWAIRPHREACTDGDVLWFAPLDALDGPEITCLGEWSLGQARLQIGNGIPETSMECVRVGREEPVEFALKSTKALS